MTPLSVAQVDFLPASYRQRGARHRDRAVRLVAGVIGLALLATAWSYRHFRTEAALAALEADAARYQTAVEINEEWQRVRAEREDAELKAQLVTYLRHPWPTTQIVGAIVTRVPRAITLTEIKVIYEAAEAVQGEPRRADAGTSPTAAPQGAPVAQDLARLKRETSSQVTVLTFAGETTDGEELYRFLSELPTNEVVSVAKLVSLQDNSEKTPAGSKSSAQFQARVVIRSPTWLAGDRRVAERVSP